MNRAHFYNKYRAYRVISQRNEEHPTTWEPWMMDFPVDLRYIPAATPGSVVTSIAMSRRWGNSEQERRDLLKSMVRRIIRRNLKAARQEDYDYEALLDNLAVETRPLP